jgi:TolB protein
MAEPQSVEFATQPVQSPARSRRTRLGLAVALILTLGAIGAILGARAISIIGRAPANELAFIDPQGGLHTIDDRGEKAQAFPADAFTFQFPAWSPDGRRIAAIGTGNGGIGVFVFDPASPQAAPVAAFQDAQHPPFYLYWTPDGRQITFLTSERQTIALRVAAADGSATGTVLEGQPMYWAQAGPGRILVHSGGVGDDAFLGETNLAASNAERQPSDRQPGPFRAPSISSTRRFSAFEVAVGDNTYRIVIAERDGNVRQEIPVRSIAMFGFSPVGSQLAYVADPERLDAALVYPFGPLRLFDAVSGNDRLLLDGDVAAFFWSPDGNTIAALRNPTEEERQVTAGNGRPATAAALTDALTPAAPAAELPGATLRLVFKDVASGQTRSERSVQVSDLFASQVLPYFDQYVLSHRFWSRDSRSIVLPLADLRPEPHLTVIRADGSESRELVPGQIAFWSP